MILSKQEKVVLRICLQEVLMLDIISVLIWLWKDKERMKKFTRRRKNNNNNSIFLSQQPRYDKISFLNKSTTFLRLSVCVWSCQSSVFFVMVEKSLLIQKWMKQTKKLRIHSFYQGIFKHLAIFIHLSLFCKLLVIVDQLLHVIKN